MNIFEAENIIKKVENENIRFPRIYRAKNDEKLRAHKDKEEIEIQEVRKINFKPENKILDMINDFIEQIVENNANTIDNWIIKQLEKFGVSESEIFDRVSMYVSGMTPFHQTNHVFIDGYYAFSFCSGCDFAENGQSYMTWIKLQYISDWGT